MKSPRQDNRRNSENNTSPKKRTFKKILKIFLLLMAFLVLVGGGGGLAMLVNFAQGAPNFDPADLQPPETSYLYDRDGEEIAQFSGEQDRVSVDLDQVPEHVQKAFLAREDERFFDHFGVDLIGIIRAAWTNLQHREVVQGASTVTQQLIRNVFLTPEQTLERKIQEAWLAIQMEREYTKEEILEMYLNRIYFGSGAYGVEAASQTYYDKSVSEISLAEGAELAGIPISPTHTNPWASEENALQGRKQVLSRMEGAEFISSQEAEEAKEEEISYGEPTVGYPYPHFVDHVLHHELLSILKNMPKYGSEGEAYNAIYSDGLRVHSTMEPSLQEHVEDLLGQDELYPDTIFIDITKLREAMEENNGRIPDDYPEAYIDEEEGVAQPQAAMVLSDPQTGEILALGGGREYEKNRDELLRFRSTRQPGSAIKPIIDYAPAFEENELAPGSVMDDAPKEFSFHGDVYRPENWDYQFSGLITAREALWRSRNIPAVRAFKEAEPEKAVEYAREMGINTILEDEEDNLALALGGFHNGVRALDMAQAFGILANQGVKVQNHTVEKIEDREGNVIWERNPSPDEILSSETAFMVSDILEESHRRFLPQRVDIDGREVATKTGTTDGRGDTYLASYTPNLVSAFWMGYDIRDMGEIPSGHHYSTEFTKRAFDEAFQDLPEESFERPSDIVETEVCTKSGKRPNEHCQEAGTVSTEMFVPETTPQDECELHLEQEVCTAGDEYHLPGDYCPDDYIEEQVFFDRPDFITTDSNWYRGPNRGPPDAGDDIPEEECTHCDEDIYTPTDFAASWLEEEELVELQWEAPYLDEDEDGILDEYRLYRREGDGDFGNPIATLSGTDKSYNDDYDFTREKTYYYRLVPLLDDGTELSELTTDITIPEKPEEEDNDENGENDNGNGENDEEEEDEGNGNSNNNNGDGENNNAGNNNNQNENSSDQTEQEENSRINPGTPMLARWWDNWLSFISTSFKLFN